MTVIAQDAEAQPLAADRDGSSRTQWDSAEGQWSAGTPYSPGALSPIAEGSHEDSSLEDLDSYFLHDDPDLQAVLAQTRCQLEWMLNDSECPSAETVENELDDRMPLGLLSSTELLTSVYNTQFDFREELYDAGTV